MKTEPSTIKTFATLRFASPSLDLTALTDLLGVEPTHSYRCGEARPSRSGEAKTYDTGMWLIETDKLIESLSIEQHIDCIDKILTKRESNYNSNPNFKRIQDFVDIYEAAPTVTLFWHGRHGAATPKVGPRLEDIVTSLNGTLDKDFATDEAEAVAS